MALSQSVFRFSLYRTLLVIACLTTIVGAPPALTQTTDSKITKKKFTPSMDVSLGLFGQLTPTRTPITTMRETNGVDITQITQGTSPSAGVLGTFHQSIKPWLGYNVNLGYSRFSESYSLGHTFVPDQPSMVSPPSSFSQGSIGTNMYETTIAYVVQGPKARQFTTFAQFGGGGLWFLPTTDLKAYNEQVRAAMLFGVGMNYKFSEHFGIRAEYRGLFYKNPDFAYTINLAPINKMFTVTNQPTISVVYTFGGEKK